MDRVEKVFDAEEVQIISEEPDIMKRFQSVVTAAVATKDGTSSAQKQS